MEAMKFTLSPPQRERMETLCRVCHVRRLGLFGSAACDDFDPEHSDLDFVVEFDIRSWRPWEDYWGLKEGLQSLFGREVDLVDLSAQRNPAFIQSLTATRHELFAA